MSDNRSIPKDFRAVVQETGELYQDACTIIEQAQAMAYRAVNEVLIKRNWLLGMRIQREVLKDKRAEYGEQVVKNLPKPGYLYFTHGRISTRDKIEGLFNWKFSEGEKMVCGYPCKKAMTTFRGRTWTAWYASSLPYSDGPWKLCGLPGVVLEASEAEGKIAFRCKKVEKNTGYGIVLVKQNNTPMLRLQSDMLDVYTPERAAELLMLEQWDQIAFSDVMLNASTNGIKGSKTEYVVKDGKKISIPSNQTAILYEVYPNIDMKEKYPPAIIK